MSSPSQDQSAVTELHRWFAEAVQPHEPALRAYLHTRFPSLSEQDDIVQDAFTRLLRAKQEGRVNYPKAFLFTTARNAALDLFRRRRTSFPPGSAVEDGERVAEDRPDAAEIASHNQELEILAEAVQTLPDRCRHVILLKYFDGFSYKEIATHLGISPETVGVHMAKGIRRCSEHFQKRGLLKSVANPPRLES